MQNTIIWHRRRVAGVPLGELLAVLCIVAVMVVVCYPAFQGMHLRVPTLSEQRREAFRRVQVMGGWAALRAASDHLLQANPRGFVWHRAKTSPLPDPIAVLQPRTVQDFQSLSLGKPRMLAINIFGTRRTGAPSEPSYSLWVLSLSAPPGYEPKLSDFRDWSAAPSPFVMQKVADGVYEVFWRR